MSVRTALALINRVWEEIENELDANFDPETQVALAWFATYGFDATPSGELITLANAKNIPLERAVPLRRVPEPARQGRPDPARGSARGLVARHRQDADGVGVRAAHRPRAQRRGWRCRGGRAGSSPRWERRRRMPARSPTACTRSPRRRAGRPRRWSTTNSPRNGRISKTRRRGRRVPAICRPVAVRALNFGEPVMKRREGNPPARPGRRSITCAAASTPFVESAHEGAPRCAMAALRQPRRRRFDPNAPLDEYGLLKTMIDNWRDVFDEAFPRTEKHRVRNFVSTALEARNATSHLSIPLQDDEALRYLDAIHQLLRAVKAPAAEDHRTEAPLRRTAADRHCRAGSIAASATARSPAPRRRAGDEQAGQGAEAVDRGGAAASRTCSPTASRKRSSPPISFAVDAGMPTEDYATPRQLLPHHLPDRRAEAGADLGVCSGLSGQGGDPVIGLQTAFGGGKTHTHARRLSPGDKAERRSWRAAGWHRAARRGCRRDGVEDSRRSRCSSAPRRAPTSR